MTSFHIESDPPELSKGDTVTLTGDLDEDISSGNVDINIELSLFKLALAGPFAVEPSLPAINVSPVQLRAAMDLRLNVRNKKKYLCMV